MGGAVVNAKWYRSLYLLGILAISSPGAADRPFKPNNKPWAAVEQELVEKKIPIDTPAVVAAALSNPDPDVRWAAVELLGLRGEISAKGAIRRILLNDESLLVRETAALALARLHEPGALEELKAFLTSSEDPARQLFLATRLAELGDLGGYPYIAKSAVSKDEHLRFLSVESIVFVLTLDKSLNDPDPETLFLNLMSDGSPKVRQECVLELSVAFFKGFSLRPYVDRIERVAREDPDSDVREQAKLLLVSWREFGKPRSVP
jgi:HEAT repeat protein